jgi:hypothetical protein
MTGHRHHNAHSAQKYDKHEITNLKRHSAVEAVVEPRHKRSNSQQSYATIVKPVNSTNKHYDNKLIVTVVTNATQKQIRLIKSN